jgi:hypothetical protein
MPGITAANWSRLTLRNIGVSQTLQSAMMLPRRAVDGFQSTMPSAGSRGSRHLKQ